MPSLCSGAPASALAPFPIRTRMKKAYSPPTLTAHGSIERITAVFGAPSQHDVLRAGGTVIATGDGSVNACIEVDGVCIA